MGQAFEFGERFEDLHDTAFHPHADPHSVDAGGAISRLDGTMGPQNRGPTSTLDSEEAVR